MRKPYALVAAALVSVSSCDKSPAPVSEKATQDTPPQLSDDDEASAPPVTAAPASPRAPSPELVEFEKAVQTDAARTGELGYGVISPNTPLFTSPDGPPLPLRSAVGQPLDPPAIRGMPAGHVMRVVSRKGAWLELANVDDPNRRLERGEHQPRCGDTLLGLDGLDVRVWAREAELMDVTAEMFERIFDDGTMVTLMPGVPVEYDDASRTGRAIAGGNEVRLDKVKPPLTKVFDTRKSLRRDVGSSGEFIDFQAPLAVNGMRVFALGLFVDPEGTVVYGRGSDGKPKVRNACAEWMATEQPDAQKSELPMGIGSGGGFGSANAKYEAQRLPAGGRLVWPTGQVAGRAERPELFLGRTDAGQTKARCYARRVSAAGTTLSLCPHPEDAQVLPYPKVDIEVLDAKGDFDERYARSYGHGWLDALRRGCLVDGLVDDPDGGSFELALQTEGATAERRFRVAGIRNQGLAPKLAQCIEQLAAERKFIAPAEKNGSLKLRYRVHK